MITNGLVSVEDGKKAIEEFAPARKVRVELHFTIDEGADEKTVLHDATAMASNQLAEALGMKAAADKPKTSRAGKKVDALPPVENFSIEDAAPKAQPKVDESIIDDSILGVKTAPKVNVSDKALHDLVVSINAKVKKPKEITEIIARFCPQDGVLPSLKRVPEAERVKFIKAMEAFAASAE